MNSIINDIENSLQSGSSIQFIESRHSKEPALVALVFDNAYEGAEGYKLLVEHFKNKKATLAIFRKKEQIDISIVAKETADAVNIRHLNYYKVQLETFLSSQPKGSGYAFAVGHIQKGRLVLLALSDPIPLVVLDKYELVNQHI